MHGSSRDHHVLVWWRSSHLPARSDFCEITKVPYRVTLTLTMSTPWVQARLRTMVYKYGRDPAICLVEEAICAKCLETDRETDGRRTIALAHVIS